MMPIKKAVAMEIVRLHSHEKIYALKLLEYGKVKFYVLTPAR